MLFLGVNGLLIVPALSLVVMDKDQDFVSVLMVKEELIKMLKGVKVILQKLSLVMKDSVYLVRLWLLIQPKEKLQNSKYYHQRFAFTEIGLNSGSDHPIFTFKKT